jgi:hypothetical protein
MRTQEDPRRFYGPFLDVACWNAPKQTEVNGGIWPIVLKNSLEF